MPHLRNEDPGEENEEWKSDRQNECDQPGAKRPSGALGHARSVAAIAAKNVRRVRISP
jgi:hypothetical protein